MDGKIQDVGDETDETVFDGMICKFGILCVAFDDDVLFREFLKDDDLQETKSFCNGDSS
jgi:hypothetical protein